MCMCPKPAMSEHAQWMEPTGPAHVRAEARETADAERRGVCPARPLLRRPVGLDVVAVACSAAGPTSFAIPSRHGALRRVQGSCAPRDSACSPGRKRAEDADRCRRRRVVVELAHELMRCEALAREPVARARTARSIRRRATSSRCPASSPAGAASATPEAPARSESPRRGSARQRRSAARASTARVPASTSTPPSDQRIARTGAPSSDALAELLRHAQRDQLRAADDAVREALLRREQLVRPAGAGDHPQSLEERERVRGLRQEAVREVRAEVLACGLVADLGPQPLVERDRVELTRSRMLPRRLGIELLRERVELRVRFLQRSLLRGGRGRRSSPAVAMRAA